MDGRWELDDGYDTLGVKVLALYSFVAASSILGVKAEYFRTQLWSGY